MRAENTTTSAGKAHANVHEILQGITESQQALVYVHGDHHQGKSGEAG